MQINKNGGKFWITHNSTFIKCIHYNIPIKYTNLRHQWKSESLRDIKLKYVFAEEKKDASTVRNIA